jgi:hypothetical protein
MAVRVNSRSWGPPVWAVTLIRVAPAAWAAFTASVAWSAVLISRQLPGAAHARSLG